MGSRRKSREFALQLLFEREFSEPPPAEELFWESRTADAETRSYARLLRDNYLENRDRVDSLIRRHAKHWKLERMATVDRNILRMAITEFLFTETPPVVVIDEAIEVARKYSGEESTEFINGLLDAVRKDLDERNETREPDE